MTSSTGSQRRRRRSPTSAAFSQWCWAREPSLASVAAGTTLRSRHSARLRGLQAVELLAESKPVTLPCSRLLTSTPAVSTSSGPVPEAAAKAAAAAAARGKGYTEGGRGGGRTSSFGSRVWHSVTDLASVPLVPLLLGFAGAIPFVALAPPVSPFVPLPDKLRLKAAEAQAAYGATILSFLGGPHWGFAMANYPATHTHSIASATAGVTANIARYTWGIIPALLAWYALLQPPLERFVILIGSLGLAFGVDAVFARLKLVPAWYLPLRVPLTVLAMGGMATTLSWVAATPMVPRRNDKSEGERALSTRMSNRL
eukprot:SM000011S19176  [mRNA]  locus=s11:1289294:1292080:- [translate_table: standard]